MNSQARSVRASATQLDQIERRWELLPGEDGSGALVLENMLSAQARLARTESAYLNSWVTYNLALMNLKKTTGELLQHEQITWNEYRDECEGIKTRVIQKPDLGVTGTANAEDTLAPIPPSLD
jgi:hypothetical protein